MNRLKQLFFTVALFVLAQTNVWSQTAGEIIAKHLEKIGGKDKITAIKTIVREADVDRGQGVKAPAKTYIIPNKAVRSEFTLQGKTSIRVVEGDNGWAITPFSGNPNADPLPEAQVKRTQIAWDITGGLLYAAQHPESAEYFGIDDFEGSDVHVIKVTLPNGFTIYHYIDTETFMDLKQMTKIKLGDKEERQTTTYSDFTMTGYGIIQPFAVDESISINKIIFNAPVDEAIFKMPPKK